MVLKLDEDWRAILRCAWSFRLILLAGLLSGLELAVPAFIDRWPHGVFTAIACLVSIAAAVARVIAQRKVKG